MNRRKFLGMIGLAPVASVAVARIAVAAPTPRAISFGQMSLGYVGEAATESVVTPSQFRALTIKAADLEIIAARRYSVEEIARFYCVRLDDIGDAS